MLHHADDDIENDGLEDVYNKPSAPYFYYRDFSALPDPKPDVPVTAPGHIPNFPAKMFAILSRPELADIVSWMPHGRSWKVHKPRDFEVKVIPSYFEHAKFSSFIRQANGWGFRRMISMGPDQNSYYHELFLRGLPHLLKKMKRPAPNCKPLADAETEPDFYFISEMSPLPERKQSSSKEVPSQAIVSVPASTTPDVVEKKPFYAAIASFVNYDSSPALATRQATPALPVSNDRFSNELARHHSVDDVVSTRERQCNFSQELRYDHPHDSSTNGSHTRDTNTNALATQDDIRRTSFCQEHCDSTRRSLVPRAASADSLPRSSSFMQKNLGYQTSFFQKHFDATNTKHVVSAYHQKVLLVQEIDDILNRVLFSEPSAGEVEKDHHWLKEPYVVDFTVEKEIHQEPFEDPFENGLQPCDFFKL